MFGYLYFEFSCFQYTLESDCVSVLVFHFYVFSMSFNLYDTVAMGLHDVRCKFLPGSSIFQEGTLIGIRLQRKNVLMCDSVHIYENVRK